MPFLFVWMIVEVLVFANFVDLFGFVVTFLAYFLPTLLGLLVLSQLKNQGTRLQNQWQQGREPTTELLHISARLLGGLLLLPPTLLTRIFGLLLVLPGIRHGIVFFVKTYFLQKIMRSGAAFFKSGSGVFTFHSNIGFGNQNTSRNPFESATIHENQIERDVEVIDITPLQVEHKVQKNDEGLN